MFESQKVRRHDKFRKEWSQHKNKCKSQMGQDQVSGGVSVLCWLAAPVAMFYGNLQNSVIRSKSVLKSSSVWSRMKMFWQTQSRKYRDVFKAKWQEKTQQIILTLFSFNIFIFFYWTSSPKSLHICQKIQKCEQIMDGESAKCDYNISLNLSVHFWIEKGQQFYAEITSEIPQKSKRTSEMRNI